MAIRVECPSCKQTLEAPDQFAGRVAICPACRTKVQIPSPLPAPTSSIPVPVPPPSTDLAAPTPASRPPETTPRPTKSIDRIESIVSDVRAELRTLNRRIGCLIALFIFVAIIGFAGAYFLLNRAIQLY